MNIFAEIRSLVITSLDEMVTAGDLPDGVSFSNVTVEPPRDALHGDMATNAAMVLAKPAKTNPRALAEKLAERLGADARVASVDVAGPGFLNLRLVPTVWSDVVRAVLGNPDTYGRSDMGQGRKVNVEYVSANPTGPLHVGHTRGAVFGDALASLLAFSGHEVTREYYINDGGSQVDTLARSVYLRYLQAHGQDVEFPEGTYPGDYLIPVGEALKAKVGDAFLEAEEADWLDDLRTYSMNAMMDLIKEDLQALGVKMDKFYSEKSLYGTGRIEEAIASLKAKDLIYWGTLPKPKGKLPDDWKPREQWLFKSSEYGDDEDRPVQKSDGSWAYFAPDIAYHYDKVQRGYDQLIDIFGADHGGYVKRMKAAVAALSDEKTPLDIKLIALVKLFKNGEEFKMSKRAGTFITLRDVIDQVGPDVTRFIMLTRKNEASLEFDFAKAVEQTKENPVFYVQYAHARIMSVLRKADAAGISADLDTLKAADLSLNGDVSEVAVAAKLAEFPRLVEIAARTNEPHRIAFYLYDLAADFHALWNKGNDHPELRFLQDGNMVTSQAKIALARAVSVVIASGLGILGVEPAQEL